MTRTHIVLAAFGLIIGIAIGVLATIDRTGDDKTITTDGAIRPAAQEPLGTEARRTTPQSAVKDDRAVAVEPTLPPNPMIDAFRLPDGTGAIDVSVTGPDGRGLAGVRVFARPTQSPTVDDLMHLAVIAEAPAEARESLVQSLRASAERTGTAMRKAVTDERGAARLDRLPDMKFDVVAAHAEWQLTATSANRGVVAGARVAFTAKAGMAVWGTVTLPTELASRDDWTVRLRPIADASGNEPAPWFTTEAFSNATAARNRRYRLPVTHSDTYTIAVAVDRNIRYSETVVIDGSVEKNIVVPPLDRSEFTVLRAHGPSGELLREITIWRGLPDGIGRPDLIHAMDDGSYWVLQPHGAKAGDRDELLVDAPGFGRRRAAYAVRPAAEVDVAFTAAAALEIDLRGCRSETLAMLRIGIDPAMDEPRTAPGHLIAIPSTESAKIDDLQPGTYDVAVWLMPQNVEPTRLVAKRVATSPGKNSVLLDVPPLYSVTAKTSRERRGQFLYLSRETSAGKEGTRREVIGDDGAAKWIGVTEGKFVVTWTSGAVPVSVAGDTVIEITDRPDNALSVELADPKGVLASVGFQSGDLIVAVDGIDFRNRTQMQTALRNVAADAKKTTVAFTVERDGKTLPLIVGRDLVQKMDGGDLGGRLVPAHR